jgi:hypothetical protein
VIIRDFHANLKPTIGKLAKREGSLLLTKEQKERLLEKTSTALLGYLKGNFSVNVEEVCYHTKFDYIYVVPFKNPKKRLSYEKLSEAELQTLAIDLGRKDLIFCRKLEEVFNPILILDDLPSLSKSESSIPLLYVLASIYSSNYTIPCLDGSKNLQDAIEDRIRLLSLGYYYNEIAHFEPVKPLGWIYLLHSKREDPKEKRIGYARKILSKVKLLGIIPFSPAIRIIVDDRKRIPINPIYADALPSRCYEKLAENLLKEIL